MNDKTLTAIVDELRPVLAGRTFGKVFQLSAQTVVIDFRVPDNQFLLISVAPHELRLHLASGRLRDLEKESLPSSNFVLTLRKQLGGARLEAIEKDATDRIVRFSFSDIDLHNELQTRLLVAQLTGRTANIFLLGAQLQIIDSLRPPARGVDGQEDSQVYVPPPPAPPTSQFTLPKPEPLQLTQHNYATLSEAADAYYRERAAEQRFDQQAATLKSRLQKEISKRRKLQDNLLSDLRTHGDADEHKRIGDLILANLTTAERQGSRLRLVDYYDERAPVIEIEVDEQKTLPEEATARFARYTKARHAAEQSKLRLEQVAAELARLETQQTTLTDITAARDEAALDRFAEVLNGGSLRKRPNTQTRERHAAQSRGKPKEEHVPGARRYRSSDGYEILVGRTARDNDHLTFRIARPHDLWFHAADYPGSHVVVRNHTRTSEVPHRTIVEAAQLAASYSQASDAAKVDVHYTARKFLSKPKGAAPGLVRMSTFRTLIVEPRESVERQ